MLRAILWDVDGTLAETERDGHRVAFNRAFEALGVPWRWDESHYGRLLSVTGGRQRLLQDMRRQPQAPAGALQRDQLASHLHLLKNRLYAQIVADGGITLRDGVAELFDDCLRAGVTMAIVTTTSRTNVDALMSFRFGAAWRRMFAAVVCGEDAPRSKPDPSAYRLALDALGLPGPHTLAIEDSPAGIAAADAAGIPVALTRSRYFAGADAGPSIAHGGSLTQAATWRPALGDPSVSRVGLRQLQAWHAAHAASRPRLRRSDPQPVGG